MTDWKFAWLLCIGALWQGACQVERVQLGSPSVGVEIVGSEWRLIELDGRPVAAPSAPPTLLLSEDTKASGFAGCNRYTGSYDLAQERLTFGRLASTRMYCAESMDVEQRFLAALEKTHSYRRDGAELTLVGDSGTIARFLTP